MNKIEELIAQLCPNGVEFRELGDVVKVLRGRRLTRNQLTPDEKYPVFHGGLEPLGYYGQSNRNANTVMVINVGASAGTVGFSSVDFWSSDGCFCISHSDIVISKFLYYTLIIQENTLKSKVRKAGIPTLDSLVILKLQIPIPPLPIQQEIVSILDKFTQLEAELETELEARRAQYEYYRNDLLNFEGKEVEWKTLGEVCKISSGGTPSTNEKLYWENGTVPWLKSEVCKDSYLSSSKTFITELGLNNSSAKYFEKDTVLMAMVGATIFKAAFLNFQATTNQNIAGIKSIEIEKLSNRYIFYYILNSYNFLTSKLSGYNMINLSQIKSIQIPIPPMEEQERIVGILDKFEALVNDISVGIPAEIKARRKQYEYYRGKLLDFKSISNG